MYHSCHFFIMALCICTGTLTSAVPSVTGKHNVGGWDVTQWDTLIEELNSFSVPLTLSSDNAEHYTNLILDGDFAEAQQVAVTEMSHFVTEQINLTWTQMESNKAKVQYFKSQVDHLIDHVNRSLTRAEEKVHDPTFLVNYQERLPYDHFETSNFNNNEYFSYNDSVTERLNGISPPYFTILDDDIIAPDVVTVAPSEFFGSFSMTSVPYEDSKGFTIFLVWSYTGLSKPSSGFLWGFGTAGCSCSDQMGFKWSDTVSGFSVLLKGAGSNGKPRFTHPTMFNNAFFNDSLQVWEVTIRDHVHNVELRINGKSFEEYGIEKELSLNNPIVGESLSGVTRHVLFMDTGRQDDIQFGEYYWFPGALSRGEADVMNTRLMQKYNITSE